MHHLVLFFSRQIADDDVGSVCDVSLRLVQLVHAAVASDMLAVEQQVSHDAEVGHRHLVVLVVRHLWRVRSRIDLDLAGGTRCAYALLGLL